MMSISTRLALAATLALGTTSLAVAQGFDPNLANRYPHYADPGATLPPAFSSPRPAEGRNVGQTPPNWFRGTTPRTGGY